jgi:hypothetical protein
MSAQSEMKPRYEQIPDKAEYLGKGTFGVWNDTATKYQYIFTSYKTRRELLESFDYLHCCVSFEDDKLHINRGIYDAVRDKKLVVNNKAYQRAARRGKFLARGFK